eukprot:gene11536-15452_t
MALLRFRKGHDMESGNPVSPVQEMEILNNELTNRNNELELLVRALKCSLELSQGREHKLVKHIEDLGGTIPCLDSDDSKLGDAERGDPLNITNLQENIEIYEQINFYHNMLDRASWLIGLLTFQSCSSFILAANQELLRDHPSIVYFLTMLVGAGGNAGNQAAVRAIREIALGKLNSNSRKQFVMREIIMACALSGILAIFGFVRVTVFSTVTLAEAIAITIALVSIVLISIILGASLPILFQLIGLDPANTSTTIQVIMDIAGVLITCLVATTLLDTSIGKYIMSVISIAWT